MSSLILLFSLLVPEAGAVSAQPDGLRMWMTVGERRFATTLADNAAARAFAAELPLTLDMSELNGNEKHADLPKPLPANASRPGTIRNGDLMLYGADTLVVFHLTFQSSYTYTRLGRVDDPSDLPRVLGPWCSSRIFQRLVFRMTREVPRSFRLLQAAGARLACVAEMNGAMQAPVTDRVRATSTTNGTSTVRSRLKRPSWDCSAWRLVSP
jgi:hypothetical protein